MEVVERVAMLLRPPLGFKVPVHLAPGSANVLPSAADRDRSFSTTASA